MIYEVKKTIENEDGTKKVLTFEIDDTIHINRQPEEFKSICFETSFLGETIFDNAIVLIFETGKVLVTYKTI